jgi:hypothetical protein
MHVKNNFFYILLIALLNSLVLLMNYRTKTKNMSQYNMIFLEKELIVLSHSLFEKLNITTINTNTLKFTI